MQTLTNKHFLLPLIQKHRTHVIQSCSECYCLSAERPFSFFPVCYNVSGWWPAPLPTPLDPQTSIMCHFRCWLSWPEAFEGVRLCNEGLWWREVMWRDGAAAEQSSSVRWQPLIRRIFKPRRGLCSCCISISLLSPLSSVASVTFDFKTGQNGFVRLEDQRGLDWCAVCWLCFKGAICDVIFY